MSDGGRGQRLQLRQVSRLYRRGQEQVAALREVSLTLYPGQLTLILGPSGGGKSTLMHLAGGMDRPTSGDITAGAQLISALKPDRLSAWRRRHVGFVFQSFHLLPQLTALENVALPLLLDGVGKPERLTRARRLLERVGVAERASHRPGELSGGQAQRVAIARALAMDPPIVLADEPTGNLDSQSGLEIMTLLAQLAHEDGRTVAVVTHNEAFVPLADRVLSVRDGRISGEQEPPETAAPALTPSEPIGPEGTRRAALFGMAAAALTRRLWRTVLTGLGVAIGVSAMVLLVSVGAGLKAKVVDSIMSQASLNTVVVTAQQGSIFSPGTATTSTSTIALTPAVLARLARLPGARAAYAMPEFVASIGYGSRSGSGLVSSLPPRATGALARRPSLAAGSYQGQGIWLTDPLAKSLFGGAKRALGRKIHVTLTGVLQGGSALAPVAASAAQPHTMVVSGVLAAGLANQASYVRYVQGLAWSRQAAAGHNIVYPQAQVLAQSASKVQGLVKAIGRMGLTATSLGDVVNQVNRGFALLETGLGVIGGVALAVAGLMIAVVMSMSVLERRREIGILRALGARRRDVFSLFVTEAVLIGLAGGLVGDAVGWLLGLVGVDLLHTPGLFLVQPWLAILGVLFGAAVAALAGIFPANHAAALSPVEALRTE